MGMEEAIGEKTDEGFAAGKVYEIGGSCVDLNLTSFTVTTYNSAGIEKSIKEDRKCKNLADMNLYTIQKNCADNNIIFNDCKLTCDNCATPSPSSIPSVLQSTVPSGLPSVVPSNKLSTGPSPVMEEAIGEKTDEGFAAGKVYEIGGSCVDLNLTSFPVTKYTKSGIVKEIKNNKECEDPKDMNSYTIRQNCADNNIILNDCKLTCDNCATSSSSSIPSVLPSTVPSGLPSVVPSNKLSTGPSPVMEEAIGEKTDEGFAAGKVYEIGGSCVDLNLTSFPVTKYTKAGLVKEIKNNKDCVKFKDMNSYTIRQNCADNNIILNDCKLTCGNCATSSPSSIPSVLPSTSSV